MTDREDIGISITFYEDEILNAKYREKMKKKMWERRIFWFNIFKAN